MSTYSGLLLRDNFQDSGIIPSTGDLWTSPDIIPYGSNVLSPSDAVSTYNGPDIGQPVVTNQNNNIYVRSKNITSAAMAGNANLYYADASLFLYPTTWQPVNVPVFNNAFVTTSPPLSAPIPVGEIALVQSPFTLGGIPPNAHYCFICVVNNNNVPFPVKQSFDSNAAFYLWVRGSGNVAYRNIILNIGSLANVVSYTTFGNDNPISSKMIFSVVGTNVPAGTTWAASCTDARLPQPFSASGTFSSSGTAGTQLTVPAKISGGNPLMSMAFTFTNPSGQRFPGGTSFKISYYQVPTSAGTAEVDDDFLALEAKASAEYRIAARDPQNTEGFETATLILLGSVLVLAS
jgi:hypothetical protein